MTQYEKLDEMEALLAKATGIYPGGTGRGDRGWRMGRITPSDAMPDLTRVTGCNRDVGDREWIADMNAGNAAAIIALRNNADALIAIARAVVPMIPQLESNLRSTAPAWLMGVAMNPNEMRALLDAVKRLETDQ